MLNPRHAPLHLLPYEAGELRVGPVGGLVIDGAVDAPDAIGVGVERVVARLEGEIARHQHHAGEADGQADGAHQRVGEAAAQGAKSERKQTAEHGDRGVVG